MRRQAMVAYRLVATYGAAPTRWTTNITDLTLVSVGGKVTLTATTQTGGGLSSFAISDAGQPLQLIGNLPYLSGLTYRSTARTTVLTLDGRNHLYQLGLGGAEAFTSPMKDNSGPGGFTRQFNPAQIGTGLTDLGQFSTAAGDFIYSARSGDPAVSVRKLLKGGDLAAVSTLRLDSTLLPEGASLDRIIAVDIGSQKVLVAISGLGNFVSTHLVSTTGHLTAGAQHPGTMGTGFTTPTAIETVRLGKTVYLVMAAQGSSSLTVFELRADGHLITRDHIIDELTTRFQSVTALATTEINGRSFVFAGGRDDGISVFTLQPDGRLLYLTTIADSDAMTLANITAIKAQAVKGRIALFVASGSEPGITQLELDPGRIGVTRIAAAGAATGTDGNDLLLAHSGTTSMAGGPGDDILIAAGASITLTGGPGADIFVPVNAKGRITIRDYEPGIDRVDLSQLGMVRSTAQLRFTPHSQGVRISYGETVIDVYSKDGRTLGPADFGDDLFVITHYNPPRLDPSKTPPPTPSDMVGRYHFGGHGNDVITGGNAGDFLSGGPGHDHIFGLDGHDTLHGDDGDDLLRGQGGDDDLIGGAGRDTLYGDDGNDTLRGGAGADLLYGGHGNDLLMGDADDDLLYGQDGDDTLIGGNGHDLLDGGRGNDSLFGGGGRDTLTGGPGDDHMDGGPGHDRMLGGVGNDVIFGRQGHDFLSGGPGHDRLDGGPGNDRLEGGGGKDSLFGGGGRDMLWGGNGHDVLDGGAGHDQLFGGTGQDSLRGGTGRDTMTGGAGRDVFIWGTVAESRRALPDLITDFQPGSDRLDLSALHLNFIGTNGFSGPRQVRWEVVGQRTHVMVDMNGDGQADMLIHLASRLHLDADDFLL